LYINIVERNKLKKKDEEAMMRKQSLKKAAALAISVMCMAGVFTGCGNNNSNTSSGDNANTDAKLTGSITAAGSSALKPLVDDAADLFNEKHPDVNITIDAGGSGEGLKQVAEGTVNIGNSDVEAAEKLDASKASQLVDHKVCVVTMAPIVNKDVLPGTVVGGVPARVIGSFEDLMKNRKMYSDMIQSVKANNIDVDDFLWNEFSKNHKIEAGENGEEH